jgi:hypothetical protein
MDSKAWEGSLAQQRVVISTVVSWKSNQNFDVDGQRTNL